MSTSRCTFLHVNGKRCTMLAVNDKDLCFTHESRLLRLRSRPTTPGTFAKVPLVSFLYPEDYFAILENVHAVSRALAHSDIDDHTASVMDKLMNTALRTLRQAQRFENMKPVVNESIRRFLMDDHGNARAVDTPAEPEPTPQPAPEPAPAAAEPGPEPSPESGQVPSISAVADEPESPHSNPEPAPDPAELQRVTSSQNLSRLLSILTREGEISPLLSNVYIFRNKKLIVAPDRTGPAPASAQRQATAYIFLTNMR